MDSVVIATNRETGPSAAALEPEPPFDADKVLDIKRQLAEGRYDIASKLDVVVDRLLEDLL